MTDLTPMISERDQVLATIRILAENRDADEAELVDYFMLEGYTRFQAELLLAFAPWD